MIVRHLCIENAQMIQMLKACKVSAIGCVYIATNRQNDLYSIES